MLMVLDGKAPKSCDERLMASLRPATRERARRSPGVEHGLIQHSAPLPTPRREDPLDDQRTHLVHQDLWISLSVSQPRGVIRARLERGPGLARAPRGRWALTTDRCRVIAPVALGEPAAEAPPTSRLSDDRRALPAHLESPLSRSLGPNKSAPKWAGACVMPSNAPSIVATASTANHAPNCVRICPANSRTHCDQGSTPSQPGSPCRMENRNSPTIEEAQNLARCSRRWPVLN
jgi:hypothetical protein